MRCTNLSILHPTNSLATPLLRLRSASNMKNLPHSGSWTVQQLKIRHLDIIASFFTNPHFITFVQLLLAYLQPSKDVPKQHILKHVLYQSFGATNCLHIQTTMNREAAKSSVKFTPVYTNVYAIKSQQTWIFTSTVLNTWYLALIYTVLQGHW